MTQHATLTADRWTRFSLDQQVLMIGNEMNRGRKQIGAKDASRLKNCYERVLRLVDLTIQVNSRYALRRELLRWRDVIAELYIAEAPTTPEHDPLHTCGVSTDSLSAPGADILTPARNTTSSAAWPMPLSAGRSC